MAGLSRWLAETGGARGSSYDEAFRELAEQGVDVHGPQSQKIVCERSLTSEPQLRCGCPDRPSAVRATSA